MLETAKLGKPPDVGYWNDSQQVVPACLLAAGFLSPYDEKQHTSPSSFAYETVSGHEIKPHGRIVALPGVRGRFRSVSDRTDLSRTGGVKLSQ